MELMAAGARAACHRKKETVEWEDVLHGVAGNTSLLKLVQRASSF